MPQWQGLWHFSKSGANSDNIKYVIIVSESDKKGVMLQSKTLLVTSPKYWRWDGVVEIMWTFWSFFLNCEVFSVYVKQDEYQTFSKVEFQIQTFYVFGSV